MPIIPVDGCGDIGVMRDGYSHDLPNNAWSRAQNVRFRDGYAERFAARHVKNPQMGFNSRFVLAEIIK